MPLGPPAYRGGMHFLLPVAAVAALASPAVPEPKPEHHETLRVTWVASRAAEHVDATPASVSVIERRDLERALARDVREALRYEPDVSVENAPGRFGLGN